MLALPFPIRSRVYISSGEALLIIIMSGSHSPDFAIAKLRKVSQGGTLKSCPETQQKYEGLKFHATKNDTCDGRIEEDVLDKYGDMSKEIAMLHTCHLHKGGTKQAQHRIITTIATRHLPSHRRRWVAGVVPTTAG